MIPKPKPKVKPKVPLAVFLIVGAAVAIFLIRRHGSSSGSNPGEVVPTTGAGFNAGAASQGGASGGNPGDVTSSLLNPENTWMPRPPAPPVAFQDYGSPPPVSGAPPGQYSQPGSVTSPWSYSPPTLDPGAAPLGFAPGAVNLPPPPAGGCFAAGTLVTLADGETKPIEKVGPGERVLSFDELTSTLTVGVVSELSRHESDPQPVLHVEAGGDSLHGTADHLVYTSKGWQRLADAADLMDSARLFHPVGSRHEEPAQPVYNLHLERSPHNYFADGLLVHNIKYGGGGI